MSELEVNSGVVAVAEKEQAHALRRTIIEAAPLAILGIDPAGRILSWSAGAKRMFGWSEQEALGCVCPTVPEEELADFHSMIRRVMAGEPWSGQVRHRRKKSTEVIRASISAAPLRNAQGECIGIVAILEDVTERERTQEAFRRSEERFRLLMQSVKDYAIFMLDPEGRVVSWNAGAERIKGYRADEIIGQHYSRFYPPEDIQDDGPGHELKVAAAEGRVEDEGWRARKDGSRFWANVITTAVRDETGTVRGFAKVTRDLTVWKQAEEEKAALLARSQALVHALAEIVYDWRPQKDDLRWEGDYRRILGYSDDEIGRDTASWTSRVHPEDLDRVLREVEDAKREGRCYDLEYRFRRRDGTYAWMHDRGVLSLDAAGNLASIVGVFRDITERKLAEKALRDSENRLKAIFLNEPECVKLVSPEGILLDMNPAGLAMIETDSLQQIAGQPVLKVVHPDDRSVFMAVHEDACKGHAGRQQFRIVGLRGTQRWVETHAVPMRGEDRRIDSILSVTRDITGRKNAEEALLEGERQLRQLLEDRERISHDLHDNIIQSLYAVSLKLESCRPLVAKQPAEVRRRLNRSLAQLKGTIRDVRGFIARAPRPHRGQGRLLAALARMFRMMDGARPIRFRTKIDPAATERLPAGAASHILAIVREATSNSLRHSNARRISVSLQNSKDHVRLMVKDDGKGFKSGVKKRSGQGLKNIALRSLRLGAQMRIETKSGRGVQVELIIPIAGPNAETRR